MLPHEKAQNGPLEILSKALASYLSYEKTAFSLTHRWQHTTAAKASAPNVGGKTPGCSFFNKNGDSKGSSCSKDTQE